MNARKLLVMRILQIFNPIIWNRDSFVQFDSITRYVVLCFIGVKTAKLICCIFRAPPPPKMYSASTSDQGSVPSTATEKIKTNVDSKSHMFLSRLLPWKQRILRMFSTRKNRLQSKTFDGVNTQKPQFNDKLLKKGSNDFQKKSKQRLGTGLPYQPRNFSCSVRSASTEKSFNWEKPMNVRPNYFVAVQISDSRVHEAIRQVQEYMVTQDKRYESCLIKLPTLHITLMVMDISDAETHSRAVKALHNVHLEYSFLREEPLNLKFYGLGHFRNTVVFAKLKQDESFSRLSQLAESVKKHFANEGILTTDTRQGFNPHLTVAKIVFSKQNQRNLKKIPVSLYEPFIESYMGDNVVNGIQLLKMTGPKTSEGYYIGYELLF